jgi:hypothetical protein
VKKGYAHPAPAQIKNQKSQISEMSYCLSAGFGYFLGITGGF